MVFGFCIALVDVDTSATLSTGNLPANDQGYSKNIFRF